MHVPGRNARSGPEKDFNTIVRTKPGAGPESAASREALSTLCPTLDSLAKVAQHFRSLRLQG